MKTIKEVSVECGVHRTTLNKAIRREAIPAHRSGTIWLVDTEAQQFKSWLASRKRQQATN